MSLMGRFSDAAEARWAGRTGTPTARRSAHLELDDHLLERVVLDVDDAGLVDGQLLGAGARVGNSISCSGVECTCISPGTSASMLSVTGSPTLALTRSPLGVTLPSLIVMSTVVPVRRRSVPGWR